MNAWREAAASAGLNNPERYSVIMQDQVVTAVPKSQIDAAHGSFDNDVEVLSKTLERVLRGKLLNVVDDLRGF